MNQALAIKVFFSLSHSQNELLDDKKEEESGKD